VLQEQSHEASKVQLLCLTRKGVAAAAVLLTRQTARDWRQQLQRLSCSILEREAQRENCPG
jgi:hypothetical protein